METGTTPPPTIPPWQGSGEEYAEAQAFRGDPIPSLGGSVEHPHEYVGGPGILPGNQASSSYDVAHASTVFPTVPGISGRVSKDTRAKGPNLSKTAALEVDGRNVATKGGGLDQKMIEGLERAFSNRGVIR